MALILTGLLELTESLVVEDVEDVIAKMSALESTWCQFSLDDFGTGYSSLAYIGRMPLTNSKLTVPLLRK